MEGAGDRDLPGHVVGSSARGDGSLPIAEERDDRSEPRAARFQGTHEEDFLRLEEDVRDVVRVTVDAETVAQAGINRSDRTDHGAPQGCRDQTERAETALLDEVDEHVGLADAEARARDSLATEGGLTLDSSDFQAGPLEGTGL
jgi:hypothetical protein